MRFARPLVRAAACSMLAAMLLSCGAPAPRAPRERAPPNKARLFGDAGLVPTRAGELARRELALASDLREASRALGGVEDAHATIRLSDGGTIQGALLVLQVADGLDPVPSARRAATEILGPVAATMTVEVVSAPTPSPKSTVPWPLVGALLGLGFSLGLVFDRGQSRLRRRRQTRRS